MITIKVNYNGVQVDISGEANEVIGLATALNEVVDRIKKAIEALAKMKGVKS